MVVEFGLRKLYMLDEADEFRRVAEAENFGKPCREIHERIEERHTPYRSEQIEQQMAHCRAFRRCVSAQRGENRRYRRSDIRAEHYGTAQVKTYPSFRTHYQRYGESGGRRLDYHRQHDADEHENPDRAVAHGSVARQEFEHLGIRLQVRNILADKIEAHEKEGETDEEFTY